MTQEELQVQSEFYFSDKYNLTYYSLCEDLVRYCQWQKDFNDHKIKPHKIIGRGHKPQYARKIAAGWLQDRIDLTKYMIINFDKNVLTSSQLAEKAA